MHKNIKLWAVLFWLLLWQIASVILNQQILLVSPIKVVLRLFELIFTNDFWNAVIFSFVKITSGFLLAVFLGVLFAIFASKFDFINYLLAPAMLAIRSIPVASFIILALIWFSSKNLSVLISFLMVMPIIYSNVLTGIKTIDIKITEMAYIFKIPFLRQVRYLYIPHIFPFFKSACETCVGLCFKAGVAAEVIGIPSGSIGANLQQAKVYLNTSDLSAWTLVVMFISLLFEKMTTLFLSKAEILLQRMD